MYCCPWKSASVNVRPCVLQALSLGHFIKHLPGAKSRTFLPLRSHSNTVTDASSTLSTTTTSCFKSLTSSQQNQIHLYVDTLLQWNQKMNLTATKEAEEVMERHIEDSLAILPPIRTFYNSHSDKLFDHINLVDVGSGAGLPGLVVAIACPEQSYGHDAMYREKFDVAIARAVAEMRVLGISVRDFK